MFIMTKKNLKAALGKSLQAEEKSVQDRFSRADQILDSDSKQQESKKSASLPPKKKTIRDSFTMPQDDYDLIKVIKDRCLASGIVLNKGEVIRAGLRTLNDLSVDELKQAVSNIERVKQGRPKQ